ncbi:putative amidase [Penicillium brevicompactum]
MKLLNLNFAPSSTSRRKMVAIWENAPKAQSAGASVTDPDLEGLIAALGDGSITSEALTKAYIARIAQVNGTVNAISQINPDAVEDAILLDKERRSGEIRGKLHGIPVLLKDTIGTLDKLQTTAGSLALVGARPSDEAGVVKKLRKSGVIVLGKTNITQWGNTRSSLAPNGWSSTSGQCYGPFYGKQDPNGSSSGCAVAAAMGLAPVTINGETWGSITYPAQVNAVVGLKPTVGLVSRAGAVPVSDHKDSKDQSDGATESIPFLEIPNYVAVCKSDALENSRIAVSLSVLEAFNDSQLLESFHAAVQLMASLGSTIIQNVDFEEWKPGSGQRENTTVNVFLRHGLESYFRQLAENPQNINTLTDLIEFMERTPEEETEKYGLEDFTAAKDEVQDMSSVGFLAAVERMKHLGADITRLLDQADCDALVFPTCADVPYDLGQNPVISIPLGFYSDEQRPTKWSNGAIGRAPNIPFVGRKFGEEKIIALAYAFEQATMVQRRAKMSVQTTVDLPTVESGKSCMTRH